MNQPSTSPTTISSQTASSPSSDFTDITSFTLFEWIHYHYQRWRSRYFIAGFHYFLTSMRLFLQRFYQLTASYSIQYDLNNRWKHIFTRQENEWDCGVACCAMAMKWINTPLSLSSLYQHEIALRGTPLWTLDLLLCLKEHDIPATMYTTSIGVQSHHENYEWYHRHLEQDKRRMADQLHKLDDTSLNIVQMSLDIKDIQSMLRDERNTVAIILVDSLTFSGKAASLRYLGHYILLLKYDPSVDEFYYFNPAVSTGLQKVSSKRLDEARLHPATDEDIIFVKRIRL